MIKLTTY